MNQGNRNCKRWHLDTTTIPVIIGTLGMIKVLYLKISSILRKLKIYIENLKSYIDKIKVLY